jgi:hypothetical protein
VFVLLMALPALPVPTGGATHVLEVVTMLVALQLVVGRRCIWLPARWQRLQLAGPVTAKVAERAAAAHPLAGAVLAATRYLALRPPRHHERVRAAGVRADAERVPRTPFSGLDTLPSLGVVVIGLGVLNRDIVLALTGAVIGAVGVATVLALGNLVVQAAQHVL